MSRLSRDVWLGAGVIAFGAFLLLVLIPLGITSPTNVRIAVLSPTIWPDIIAVALMLIGGILMLRALIAGPDEARERNGSGGGWLPRVRIAAAAILMAALFLSLPVLGMPIASAIALLAYAALVRAGRPVATILTAILLPLMMYAFFSKIAGVPIPQGQLVRLP
jgi:putative tricarboxylic transport membrane protein